MILCCSVSGLCIPQLLSQLPRNYSEEEMGGEGDGQEGRWQQAFLPSVFDSYGKTVIHCPA